MSAREEFERQLKIAIESEFLSALKGTKEEEFPYFYYVRKMIQDGESAIIFPDEDRYAFGLHKIIVKNDKYPFQLEIEHNLTICHLIITGTKEEEKIFQLGTYTKSAYEYFLRILERKQEKIGAQVLFSKKNALKTIVDFMK